MSEARGAPGKPAGAQRDPMGLEHVIESALEPGYFISYRRAADWHALVCGIRSRHGRKSSFMPGFERLVEGQDLRGPSFLDRARTRWNRSTGEGSMNS